MDSKSAMDGLDLSDEKNGVVTSEFIVLGKEGTGKA
jgi:hypothetical protein